MVYKGMKIFEKRFGNEMVYFINGNNFPSLERAKNYINIKITTNNYKSF